MGFWGQQVYKINYSLRKDSMNKVETINPQDKISFQEKINQLQYKQQIQGFNKNLEKGDLGLSEPIENGFILYGDTRAGKTALAHVLSGNSLRGVKINGDLMVMSTTTKNKKAKIGNTMNSQTLVPNNFPVKIKGKTQQFNLIDTPGYGDTNGMLTILANGYYHYRLYSKVINMKFILCFDVIQLQNTCVEFIKTIEQWTKYFDGYLQVRQQIWRSVAFVITKVEDKPSIKQDLVSKLQNIVKDMRTPYEKNVEEAIKQLIQYIIKEDRLFYIKKVKEGETLVSGDLLEKIDKKIPHWWTRDYDAQKKQVDMSKVSFPLSQQIIESTTKFPMCKRQFQELISYYNLRIKEFRQISGAVSDNKNCSLAFVIQQLIQDAMGHPDSHKFINVMENYINLYYNKYDDSYEEEREKLQKQLFQIKVDQQSMTQRSRGPFRGKDKNYLVKKFRCLEEIELLKNEINSIPLQERDIKSIEHCANAVYDIIKEFNHVAFKRSFASKIIYKYGYIIHRIIEEAKIFTLLIEIYGAADRAKIMEQTNNQFIDLLRQLIDFMGVSFKYNKKEVTYEELHLAFINQFNFNDPQYQSLLINEDLVNFFAHVDIIQEDDMDKQTQVVLKYSDKVLEEAQKLSMIVFDKQKGKLIRRLTSIRINCEASYELKKNPQEKNYFMFTIRKATKNLGKLLELLGQYKLSRSVYTTIRFVDSVCKLYRSEMNSLKKANLKNEDSRKKQFDLRIQFSKYLAEHFRQYQAIEVLQQSFELAENTVELKRVKEQLSSLKLKMKDSPSTDYQQKLFNQEFFDIFNDKLSKELETFSHSAVAVN